jgi:hypothetical protein
MRSAPVNRQFEAEASLPERAGHVYRRTGAFAAGCRVDQSGVLATTSLHIEGFIG